MLLRKPLTISIKSSISNNWLSSKYASGISKFTLHKWTKKGKHLHKNEKHVKTSLAMQLEKLFWNAPEESCFYISRETCVAENTFFQIYSFQPGTLLMKNIIKYLFLRPIWIYSQLLFYQWDDCDQLSLKLPRLLRGNTWPI